MTLSARGGRASPPYPVPAGSEYVPAQASQARQRPIVPNLHADDRQESGTDFLTVLTVFPDPGRPHTGHGFVVTDEDIILSFPLHGPIRKAAAPL